MPQTLAPAPFQKFFDNNGAPLVSGKLFTYTAGTSTKVATYSDSAGTLNANPIVLDFRGECNLWLTPNVSYKLVLAPANDTDPPTSPVKTVDNVVNAQLITLYGGVDTGTANAYILTFTANYSAYADGIVIYWIPANTNSGPSTINVNGLGPVAILNNNGDPLYANQIIAGSVIGILYQSGHFIIFTQPGATVSYEDSWTPTWFGLTAIPAGTMYYQVVGSQVTLEWVGAQGTSNATGFSIGNVPLAIRPSSVGSIASGGCLPTMLVDNGVVVYGACRFVGGGTLSFSTDDPPSETGFTNSGTKGLDNGWTLTYLTR